MFAEILKFSLPKVPGKQLGMKLVNKKWVYVLDIHEQFVTVIIKGSLYPD